MERTFLQWNLVNWITVVLMASLGYMVVGLVLSGIRQYQNGGASE